MWLCRCSANFIVTWSAYDNRLEWRKFTSFACKTNMTPHTFGKALNVSRRCQERKGKVVEMSREENCERKNWIWKVFPTIFPTIWWLFASNLIFYWIALLKSWPCRSDVILMIQFAKIFLSFPLVIEFCALSIWELDNEANQFESFLCNLISDPKQFDLCWFFDVSFKYYFCQFAQLRCPRNIF